MFDAADRARSHLVTIGTPTVQAAKEAMTSLSRPGGNITGVTHNPGPEISGKGLQLLKEAVPPVSRVAICWDSSALHEGLSVDAQRKVARAIDVRVLPMDVKTLDELTTALPTALREQANGLFVYPNFINGKHEKLILEFAATNRVPTMFKTKTRWPPGTE